MHITLRRAAVLTLVTAVVAVIGAGTGAGSAR